MKRTTEAAEHVRNAARTQTALLDAALQVFLRDGYGKATTEEIADLAGVTRGALYHHFANKHELFRAVIERVQREIAEALVPTGPVDASWEAFIGRVLTALDSAHDPATRRLLLIEAPAVLGWIDIRRAQKPLLHGIAAMLEPPETNERGPSIPAAMLARLLVAAVEEAMLYLAHTDDPKRDHTIVQAEMRKILEKTGLPGGQ
ncbi:TetR/AcrR family transcriptional regulator [Rhodococcus sp. B50]|uniref:TetR/AcrR family transcriptional regulator n=1 Tax=Rhodococcus sp. B50 TaxID=2682847 RepID=UPI0027DC4C5B|nr:TetR family transcriptional regulator [Rhodococcus sp. B50]MBS9372084.1 putative HTH-type transcriptional regulator TtgW [Rhodococcus sp. B50]